MVRDYASALVPDFQEVYGLRLTQAVDSMHPVEVVLLIAGLPDNSRYAARLMGEERGVGWSIQDWLALDTRNALEGLRATVVNMAAGKDRKAFREWDHYPGKEHQEQAKAHRTISRLESIATPVTE